MALQDLTLTEVFTWHARHLFFEHPVKKIAISIIAPTPKEALWAACES